MSINNINIVNGGYTVANFPYQQQVYGVAGAAPIGQVQNNMVYNGNQWLNLPTNGFNSGPVTTVQNEITIFRNGKTLNICETLDRIMDMLNMISPDKKLLAEYPALQEAYDHYNEKVNEALFNPEIKQAYDSYKLIEIMVKESQ